MKSGETRLPCALARDRAEADRFLRQLAEAGIEGDLRIPGARYHRLTAGAWEVLVPATQVSRARAILSNA